MAETGPRSRPSRRSRIVSALKILLPLIALGLLGAVFIWRAEEDPGIGLTFTETDIAAMQSGLKVTGPQLSGASLNGDLYDFRAAEVVPDNLEITSALITTLNGKVSFRDGRTVRLASDSARLDGAERTITLESGIDVETSDGYTAQASRLTMDISTSILTAEGPITADGPQGQIAAGGMVMQPADGSTGLNDALIRFTGGVTLRYTPEPK